MAIFSIISICYLVQANNINIEDWPFFADNFAIWRGASYFILYIWVIGIGIKVMETYTINYRLIFALDNCYVPTSQYTLVVAAIATSLYVGLYAVYLLCLS